MSKISTVYNGILSAFTTLFSTKKRIFDPYNLGNNPVHYLRDAWGIKKLGTSFGENEICNLTEVHSYSIVIVREAVRYEAETTVYDSTLLAMEEDVVLARQRLFNVDQLGIGSSIRSIDLKDVSGLEFNYFEKSVFFSFEVFFDVSITEEI